MKFKFRIDGDYLLFWETTAAEVRGSVHKPHVAAVYVHTDKNNNISAHIYLSGARGHKPVLRAPVSRADADTLLNWHYGAVFPPVHLLEIDDADAFKVALDAWLKETDSAP